MGHIAHLRKWFWRRGLFNFVNVFSFFRNYLPLEKDRAFHLNKLESTLPKDALCTLYKSIKISKDI